jgi:hypothetical protein
MNINKVLRKAMVVSEGDISEAYKPRYKKLKSRPEPKSDEEVMAQRQLDRFSPILKEFGYVQVNPSKVNKNQIQFTTNNRIVKSRVSEYDVKSDNLIARLRGGDVDFSASDMPKASDAKKFLVQDSPVARTLPDMVDEPLDHVVTIDVPTGQWKHATVDTSREGMYVSTTRRPRVDLEAGGISSSSNINTWGPDSLRDHLDYFHSTPSENTRAVTSMNRLSSVGNRSTRERASAQASRIGRDLARQATDASVDKLKALIDDGGVKDGNILGTMSDNRPTYGGRTWSHDDRDSDADINAYIRKLRNLLK